MINRFKKWISLMLVVCMVVTAMPVYAFAETESASSKASTSDLDPLNLEETKEKEIVAEDESLRQENVKHFLNSDGSFTAISYSNPVHYKENGNDEWIEIDNTLVESTSYTRGEEVVSFAPKSSPLDVSLTETDDNSYVYLRNGEYEISWHYEMSSKGKSEKKEIKNAEKLEKKNEKNQEKIKVNTLSGRTYKGKEDNVDLEVILDSNRLKENLILHDKNVKTKYVIVYEIGELTPKEEDDKTIGLFNSKKERIFTITAPLMEDANKVVSSNLSLKIDSVKDGNLRVKLEIDKEWLKDEERVFPVIVDPFVFQETNTTAGDAAALYKAQSAYPIGTLSVGNDMGSVTGKARSFVKFTLPTLKPGDMVTEAHFGIAQYRDIYGYSQVGNPSLQINLHKVTSSWTESAIRSSQAFSQNPTIESSVADFASVDETSVYRYITFDVSRIVKEWYLGQPNYGICLKSDNENAWALVNFIATDSMDVNARPYLQINYLNNKGLEDRWTYHTQERGDAGTGYVNDYTGNLVYIIPLVGTTGNIMPVGISLVYNGYQAGYNYDTFAPIGIGWRLNIQEKLVSIKRTGGLDTLLYDAGFRFVYHDGDGTSHYLKINPDNTSECIDEEGLGLTATVVYNPETYGQLREYYKLAFDDGSYLTFNQSGYLIRSYNSNGKYIHLGYNFDAEKAISQLSYIEDGAGDRISFTLDDEGYITVITDTAGREYILTYAGTMLVSITYPDGTKMGFTYDNSRLTVVKGRDRVRVKYHYPTTGDAATKSRVIKIEEYSNEDQYSYDSKYLGKSLDISYGRNKTDFIDDNGNKTTYIFDNYGRTVNIVTTDGSAQSFKYQNPVSGSDVYNSTNAHLVSKSTSIANYIKNILYNHSFEESSLSSWSAVNASLNTSHAYLGIKSLEVSQGGYAYQTPSVISSKDYTFSSYVKTGANSKAKLLVECLDSSGNVVYTKSSQVTNRVMDWERIYVSFTVPNDAVTTRVKIINEGTEPSYFDCLQLEEGLELNQYNLVTNGSFDNSLSDTWTGTNTTSGEGRISHSDSERNSYVVRMYGEGSTNKYFSQTIKINRPVKDTFFKISMLGKGDSVALPEGFRRHGFIMHSYFTDGTHQGDYIGFNADYVSGWQRLSGVIAYAPEHQNKTLDYIIIRTAYCLNENTAYYDDVLVQIDETGMSYSYDSEGNLINAIDNGGRTKSYSYSSAGEILSATNEDNKQYEYTYDTSHPHRLLSATSKSSNLKFSFGYGNYGNVTSQTVQGVDGNNNLVGEYIKTESTYTANGNYIASETDDRGKSYIYDYNQTKGILNSSTDKNGNITYYDYNNDNDYLTAVSNKETETDSDATTVNYTYSDRFLLTGITTKTTNYSFTYDYFSNPVATKAGDMVLNTNTYAPNNGNLLSSTYGNNFIKGYMYDKYDRLNKVTHNGVDAFTYSYNAEGYISRHEDKVNNKTYQYTYDIIGRPVIVDISDGSYIESSYDEINLSTGTRYGLGSVTKNITYTYSDRDNLPESVIFDGKTVTNNYDGLTRLTSKNYSLGNTSNVGTVSYSYLPHSTDSNRTTGVIGSISYFGAGIDLSLGTRYYDYDNQGNILREYRYSKDETGLRESYKYDSKNQLVRHDSKTQNKTFTYSYDNAGNILSKTTYNYTTGDNLGTPIDTASYQYQSNDNWGDKLTSYDGKAITYDAIGNMTSFDGNTYSWQGRELTGITTATDSYSYKYNAEGIRTEKTVNGAKTSYFLNGSQILAQTTDGNTIWFIYDSQGQRVALTKDGQTFYYMYNVQGDVIGLVDADTGNVVATYDYDAWGNCTLVTNAEGETIGDVNPFRYRGYYYDEETGLYYLNSRYYSSEFGRFISADSIIDNRGIITQNLYAYCVNNPVNCNDSDGNIAAWAITGLVGGLIGAATGAITASASGDNILQGALVGFATGFVTSVFCGIIGGKALQLAKTGNIFKAGAAVLVGAAGNGAIAGMINAGSQLIKNISTEEQQDSKDSIFNYIDTKEAFEVAKSAAIMAPVAMLAGVGVDSAFGNPEIFKVTSEALGYGIANFYVGGNVSLLQTVIDLF